MASSVKIKFTGFLAELNLTVAVEDHLGHLVRTSFPDFRITWTYSNARSKASCILNGAVKSNLQANLVKLMQTSFFSLNTDGSNDQNLENMNPVTVIIFDINQHKVVTQ